MDPDEGEEGMGTSGEIRREELEAAQSAALELRARRERVIAELEAEQQRLEKALQSLAPSEARSPRARASSGTSDYGDFIKDELDVQDQRKASFEQRGLAVITTSGVLVTLLFALAALSTKRATTFVLPHAARTWLFVALVLFFLSALAALLRTRHSSIKLCRSRRSESA